MQDEIQKVLENTKEINLFDGIYNVYQIIERKKMCNNIAIVETYGQYISYSDLYLRINHIASKIKVKTENIAIIGYPVIDAVISIFSIWKSGNTALILNPGMKTNELEYILDFCCVNIIIDLKNDFQKFNKNHLVINIDNEKEEKQEEPYENGFIHCSNAILVPTSGTTSSPKIVSLSHKSLLQHAAYNFKVFSLKPEVRELLLAPLSAVTNICGMIIPTFMKSGTLYLYNERFNPLKLVNYYKEYKISFTGMTPSLLQQFLILKDKDIKKLEVVEGICIGGENVATDLINKFKKRVPNIKIISMYGLTETGGSISGWQDDINLINHAVGKLYPGIKVKIINENKECKIGEYGEIYLASLPLFDGYYKNIKETNAVLKDGWLKTGDIGKIDESGYLYIKGRMKNIIIVGGENVSSEEVEECLMSHPAIKYAFVSLEKDAVYGENIVAEVVLNYKLDNFEKILKEWCNERMMDHKVPRKIIVLENSKLIGMGKRSKCER